MYRIESDYISCLKIAVILAKFRFLFSCLNFPPVFRKNLQLVDDFVLCIHKERVSIECFISFISWRFGNQYPLPRYEGRLESEIERTIISTYLLIEVHIDKIHDEIVRSPYPGKTLRKKLELTCSIVPCTNWSACSFLR